MNLVDGDDTKNILIVVWNRSSLILQHFIK